MNDSEKNAMLVLQKMCDIKSAENTIVAETINTLYNLINRQQAEIDRLNIDLKAMRGAANGFKAEAERLTQEKNALNGTTEKYIKECENRSQQIAEGYRKEIKSEAVREFVKTLKMCAESSQDYSEWVFTIRESQLDKLVEEMGCNDE